MKKSKRSPSEGKRLKEINAELVAVLVALASDFAFYDLPNALQDKVEKVLKKVEGL